MNKIVIRNKVVRCISSKLIYHAKDRESFYEEMRRLGTAQVLKEIYQDDVDPDVLGREYHRFLDGSSSDYFRWMYIVDEKFGVVLDAHIDLYKFDSQIAELQKERIPWIYPESKKYLGETWWFEDDEILEDLKKLPVIEFLDKYRGI